MQNKNEYAVVYWTTADLDEYEIPDDKKEHILSLLEEQLQDRMIEAGWEVIYEYMTQNNYQMKEVSKS